MVKPDVSGCEEPSLPQFPPSSMDAVSNANVSPLRTQSDHFRNGTHLQSAAWKVKNRANRNNDNGSSNQTGTILNENTAVNRELEKSRGTEGNTRGSGNHRNKILKKTVATAYQERRNTNKSKK